MMKVVSPLDSWMGKDKSEQTPGRNIPHPENRIPPITSLASRWAARTHPA